MLLVMMVAAILLISLTAALPSIYTEAQREKETELIFRGTQYARAVFFFHQQFHRYPTSVKELLRTNDMSFLRRAYRDPMTRDGKWRFIHATATGIIIDSKNITVKKPVKPGESSADQSNGEKPGTTPPSESNPQQSESPPTNTNPFGHGEMLGAYIVGVASTSTRQSIRVYNDHTHYDKWEFLGVPGVPGSVVQLSVLIPGLTAQPPPGAGRPTSQWPGGPTPGSPKPGTGRSSY